MSGKTPITTSCPEESRWRALLDDSLPPDEQADLAAHLESCDACRDTFASLAAGDPVWDAARELGVSSPETEAYPRLAGGHFREPSGLPFLEPTSEPERIGAFGPYEVIARVGRGGMGVVLKAFDPSLHRVVAVKVLAPQLSAGAAARRRFVREARAAASVAHEHVVTIHAVDEWKGWPYLVMQYVGGKSLQERLDRTGPLEVKEILRIAMQTAQGLAAAHAQGLVHRDIKPANILLENGVERVKITDFGLARAVDDPSLTQAGVVAGTPQYMSPEQARGDGVDARSDLFSLGSVMYAMATGRPPFRGDSTVSVLRRVCDEEPRPIRDANPDVPGWLDAVIRKLLAKDPAFRFTSAEEVADVLGDYLARLQRGETIHEDVPLGLSGLHDTLDVGPSKLAPFEDVGPEKIAVGRRPGAWRPVAAACVLGLIALGTTEALGVTKVTELVATVLRIKVPEGTLVLEIDDPDMEVAVDGGDVVIRGGGVREIKLKAGTHELRTLRDGVPHKIELVEIRKGDKQTLKVELEPTPRPGSLVLGPVDVLRSPLDRPGPRLFAVQMRAQAAREAARIVGERRGQERALREAKARLDRATEAFQKGLAPQSDVDAARLAVVEAEGTIQDGDVEREQLRVGREVAEALELASAAPPDAIVSSSLKVVNGLAELAKLRVEHARQLSSRARHRAELLKAEMDGLLEQVKAGTRLQRDVDEAASRYEVAQEEVEARQQEIQELSDKLNEAVELRDSAPTDLDDLLEAVAESGLEGDWTRPIFALPDPLARRNVVVHDQRNATISRAPTQIQIQELKQRLEEARKAEHGGGPTVRRLESRMRQLERAQSRDPGRGIASADPFSEANSARDIPPGARVVDRLLVPSLPDLPRVLGGLNPFAEVSKARIAGLEEALREIDKQLAEISGATKDAEATLTLKALEEARAELAQALEELKHAAAEPRAIPAPPIAPIPPAAPER